MREHCMGRDLFLRFLLWLIVLSYVEGWGKEGHQIVGNLAYHRLSNDTQTMVKNILRKDDGSYGDDDAAGSPLASVANWADKVRFTKAFHWSTPLHYVDVQDGEIQGGCPCSLPNSTASTTSCQFVYTRDCTNDFCAAGAIVNYTGQLAYPAMNYLRHAEKQQLRESLMFTTHFIGDIHQPLHSSRTSDKGGNTFIVDFNAQEILRQQRDGSWHSHWNLHSVWDSGIIERAIFEQFKSQKGLEDAVSDLIHQMEESRDIDKYLECSDGGNKQCTSEWAQESLDDALEWAYRNSDNSEVLNGSVLSDEYFHTRLPVVLRRLAAAGVRLAASIEDALGTRKLGNFVVAKADR